MDTIIGNRNLLTILSNVLEPRVISHPLPVVDKLVASLIIDQAPGPRSAYFLHPQITRYYGVMTGVIGEPVLDWQAYTDQFAAEIEDES